jgi:hypothetical protein
MANVHINVMSSGTLTTASVGRLADNIARMSGASENADCQLDGNPARRVVYAQEVDRRKAMVEQILSIRGSRTYTIAFTAPSKKFERRLPEVQEIVESFHWLPGGEASEHAQQQQ